MLRIGLTGGMGAGKSTILQAFNEVCSIPIYESDLKTNTLTAANKELIKEINSFLPGAYFGTTSSNHPMNRSYVADVIFKDPKLKKKLEDTIYPYLMEDFEKWCKEKEAMNFPYIIFESAVLYETGLYKEFDKIIVVKAPMDVRLRRLKAYRQISEDKAMARIKTQASESDLLKIADYVINNSLEIMKDEDNISNDINKVIDETINFFKSSERKGNLINRIKQIDHKIKYISYGSTT